MSDLTFIKNLPSEFTGFYLVPANSRYPVQWGYTNTKEVYHIIQLIGDGQYLFIVTDNDYNYWGHSDKFSEANKLGQEYGQTEKVEQVTDTALPTVSNTVKGDTPSLFSNWVIIASTIYNAKYGDKYTILATKSKDSQNFLDIICDTNNNYITLGSDRYSQTLEVVERMSLLAECGRLGI